MVRGPRRVAQSGCYHIVQRGNGQQIIFEQQRDYQRFLELLVEHQEPLKYRIIAYCLMENHFHLLLQTKQELGPIMHVVTRSYTMYYNTKYERVGHLFQGRFHSEVIDTQSYFYNVIQYIHLNPEKSKICPAKYYHWSSYQDYVGTPQIADTSLLYKMINGKNAFLELMKRNVELKCFDIDAEPAITDEKAMNIIRTDLGLTSGSQILSLSKAERNNCIRFLKSSGLTTRQIARLSGVSKSLVAKI